MSSRLTVDLVVQQGVPEQEQLVDILQQCFDGPRSHDHVAWKYDQFPDFEDEHVFFVSDPRGNVVALRRLFYKQIRVGGEQIETFIGGDSCVVPAYRGMGLFSELLSTSMEFEQRVGRDLSLSFNQHGGRTFGSKRRRDWNYQSLPLFVRVFTPELVFPQYCKLVVQSDTLRSLIGSKPFTTMYRYLPDTLVAALVEAASTNNPLSAVDRFPTRRSADRNGTIETLSESHHDGTVTELLELYQQQSRSYAAQFRRDREDIEHMLSHPCLEDVLRVYDEEGLAGVAILIGRPMDPIKEGRVLDLVAKNSRTHQQLIKRIELAARDANMDLLSMVSRRDPLDNWARVDKQVMMWKAHTELPPIDTESTLLGFYDIL